MTMVWRKSSYSPPDWQGDTACVEVGKGGGMFAVRDSKNPDGPVLAFGAGEFGGLLSAVKAGRFNFPDTSAPH